MKRKIAIINSYDKVKVLDDIRFWQESEEAQNYNIISVNGVSDPNGYIITYILYEENEGIQLNS